MNTGYIIKNNIAYGLGGGGGDTMAQEVLASTLTQLGVPTESDASFTTINENIFVLAEQKYDEGNEDGVAQSMVGDAVASEVLSGKTFTTKNDVGITGTMTNNSSTIKSSTLSLDSSNQRVQLAIPTTGYYDTNSKLYQSYTNVANEIGLTANKIVDGNTILGVTGTAKAFPTSCTVLLSTTTNYTSSKSFTNCPVGKIIMIDVYGYSGTITVSGINIIKQTNSNIAQYATSFIVGVTTNSTVVINGTSFYLEYVAYLS